MAAVGLVSRMQREKGMRAELEVSQLFQAAGFDCNRTPASGGLRITGDLYGNLPLHVEVKRQEVLRLPLWLRQAADEAPQGITPLVAFRQSRTPWYGAMPLEAVVALLADRRAE